LPGDGASHDAGFGAVSVDDVGADLFEETAELSVAGPVAEGVDFAAEVVDESDVEAALLGAIDEASFGAETGAGDERNLVSVEVVLVLDGQEGVFLGTSEDETGDEMDDLHGGVSGDLKRGQEWAGVEFDAVSIIAGGGLERRYR